MPDASLNAKASAISKTGSPAVRAFAIEAAQKIGSLEDKVDQLSSMVSMLGPPRVTTPPTVATGQGSVSGRWFADASHLNTKVVASPTIDVNNTAIISTLVANTPSGVWSNGQGGGDWSTTVYTGDSTTPTVTITLTVPCLGSSTIVVGKPVGAVTSPDTDAHYNFMRTDTGQGVEFQGLNFGTLTAHSASVFNVITGLGNSLAANNRVAVLPTPAGLIRPSEVAAGVIPHAIRMGLSCCASAFRYPAIQSDGSTANGVPSGGHLWLPRSVSLSGLDTFNTMVAVALQEYGAFISDSTGSSDFYIQSCNDGSRYFGGTSVSTMPKSIISQMKLLAAGF